MSCLTLVNLASTHLICFTFKLWTIISPRFKASPLHWTERVGNVFLQIFQYDIQFFQHSSVLCDILVQLASISGLQLVSCHRKLTRSF